MSSKRQKGASSRSSRVTFDQDRFVSEDAATRYQSVLAGKTLVMERGLTPDAELDGEMAVQIAERNWADVTVPPGPAVISVVKEFYANAIEAVDFVVQVRGKSVYFSPHAINAYFHLPNYADSAEDYLCNGIKAYDLDELLAQMCKPGTQWTKKRGSTKYHSFSHTTLSRYAKAWYSFICSNLIPTTHQSEVSVDRAVLLYAIVTDEKIDVGSLISDGIAEFLKGKTTGSLPFPSLITGLCRQAGVTWGGAEVLQPPMAAIDHSNIERYVVWPDATSEPRGRGFLRTTTAPALHPVAPPPPQSSQSTSLDTLQDAITRLERSVNRQSRRQNRRMDAMAHRLDTVLQFNVQFANTLAQLHSGGSSSSNSAPIHFPDPPVIPDYPSDSPDDDA